MKKVLIIISTIAGLIAAGYLVVLVGEHRYRQANRAYFATHDIRFTGIVTKRVPNVAGWGMLGLAVKNSNTVYNPFTTKEDFFLCYVDTAYAELYLGGLDRFELGDSVIVSSPNGYFYLYRKDEKIATHKLFISISKSYYDWVRKNHASR